MKNYFKLLLITLFLFLPCLGCQKPFAPAAPAPQEETNTDPHTLETMTVSFLDVGQGDCTIIQSGEHTMVIDAGDNGSGKDVVSYLSSLHITKVDYLILTHPDADHVGGADTLINAVLVEQILMPNVENRTKTFSDVEDAISDKSIPVTNPFVGQRFTLGDAQFTILGPEKTNHSDLNNSSIGIKLSHGTKSFVLCGDAEEISETQMVNHFGSELECDVLKSGHHGSSTATCDAFLEATNPTWAVISCGKGNRYGHPHAEVLSKLDEQDVQVYRTDQLGTITAVSDGNQIKWSTNH